MASRQQEFVNRVYNEAISAGLPDAQARLAASQAALETNYGKSVVGNNYFGIKAGKSYAGPSVSAKTWEDTPNGRVNIVDRFRSYDSPTSSFRDWASNLGRRWGNALSAPTLADAVEGLNYGQPGGYATDRSYGNKIRAIDRKYGPQTMEVGFDAPTPTSRPPDLESILSAPAPTNSLLNAPVTSVQRVALKEPSTVAAFDNGRFAGPQVNMQTVPELSYDRFSTQPFDAARFGPVTETGKTTNQLRRALLDQQLDAGVLPNLSNPAYAAMAPSSATVRAPSTIANASVQAPAAPMNSLLSPQEENAVAAQRNYLSSLPLNKPTISPDRIKSVLGNVGPAIAGGLLGGPLGALAGGFIGKQIFSNNILAPPEERMPEAPKSQSRGDGSLTSYGRSVANSSGQFGRALSSGKGGLW